MSVGATGGVVGSATGVPLAHTKGTEVERGGHDATGQQRQVDSNQNAENAAGIGQTAEDRHASDRDADGRRLWELDRSVERLEADDSGPVRQSKDTSGTSGNTLDLTG